MTASTHLEGVPWWQPGVVYQVYPRSFADSDGNGVGDLRGITSHLGYLEGLGVDALWLSPIYRSPMADMGYDVADYLDVDPLFGTLEDFDALLAEAHARGLRVLLDFVPNHTSIEHPWFIEARASRSSPRRDWYLWRDAASGGGPPNNWLSNFGGSAWTWDEGSGQYYYHAFLPEQPDLNWRNPEVRAAMLEVLRFWLERGVDGFRVDVIWHLVKDAHFRDNPLNPDFTHELPPHQRFHALHNTDQPEVHEVIATVRSLIDEYPDRLLIGELYLPVERVMAYYGERGEGLHLPMNAQLLLADWTASALRAAIEGYESRLPEGAWPNWVLGNHDRPRIASRVGEAQARVAAMLLLTLRGTPTLYYGDELGMVHAEVTSGAARDAFERRVPGFGRDPSRAPMAWDAGPHAGFTSGEPWLPLAPGWRERNVEAETRDPRSMLALHRALLRLRRTEPSLALGRIQLLESPEGVLAYRRDSDDGDSFVVALNLGGEEREQPLPPEGGTVVLSTHLDRTEDVAGPLRLRADEGVLLRLAAPRS